MIRFMLWHAPRRGTTTVTLRAHRRWWQFWRPRFTANALVGHTLYVNGQKRTIVDANATTLTVDHMWEVAPSGGVAFGVIISRGA